MGTKFLPVLSDVSANYENVENLIFCSGKIYYDLFNKRKELKNNSYAIIRIEELAPFPVEGLLNEIKKYKKVKGIYE